MHRKAHADLTETNGSLDFPSQPRPDWVLAAAGFNSSNARVKTSFRKALLISILVLLPVALVFITGMIPMLGDSRKPRIAGKLDFPKERPEFVPRSPERNQDRSESGFRFSSDWLGQSYEKLMTWEHNPWKRQHTSFGTHCMRLMSSDLPSDKEKARDIQRIADDLLLKLLARYPEFAISNRSVPPERNGFLKWLELSERIDVDPNRKGSGRGKAIAFPGSIAKQLDGSEPWNPDSIRSWLASEKPLIDEIRNIGLMPNQSNAGMDVQRWSYMPIRFAISCCDALLMDARISAGDGDVASAIESVNAAMGIARHLGDVETPSLASLTGRIAIEQRVRQYSIEKILPAVPSDHRNFDSWETTLIPDTDGPSRLTAAFKGEWHLVMREYLLPMVADVEDPKYPPDPEALLDTYSAPLLKAVRSFDGKSPAEIAVIPEIGAVDNSHLSRNSREVTDVFWIGIGTWSRGWIRHQSSTAMTKAAFAIMKGQALPTNPVHGTAYLWNPVTRQLSLPPDPAFKDIKPIIVPSP